MKSFRVVFKITREYTVEIEAASETEADEICDSMEVDEIERKGAGRVCEEVEIVSLNQYAEDSDGQ